MDSRQKSRTIGGKVIRAAFYLYGGSTLKINTKFLKKTCFSSFYDLELNRNWLLATVFLHCCQNCFLSLYNSFWLVIKFYSFILFEIRARNVETFCAKASARLLKLHSTSTDEHFEEKPTSRKNIIFHIFSGLRGKTFRPVTTLSVHYWQDYVFHFWSSILRFFPNNFKSSHQFWDLRRNFFHV